MSAALEKIKNLDKEYLYSRDLSYFAEEVLGMEINHHHERWGELTVKNEKICINSSRDHGKSYYFSFAYPIWRCYFNWTPDEAQGAKKSLGYIFSNTQDQSIKFLQIIKDELEDNPKLRWLVPEKKELWSKTEIKLSNGARIRARGWGVSVRGGHPSWVICDDVLNDETIYSELIRTKQNDYFFSAVVPMVIPGGQLVVVGTPMVVSDLYGQLDGNDIYHFEKFPAINEFGEALWPTRYSKQSLISRRDEVGTTRFSREYLCSPISAESSLFPEKILKRCFDENFSMGVPPNNELSVYMGVDLAISANVGADYTVMVTLGLDTHGNRWLLDIQRRKGLGMTDQLKLIEQVAREFNPQLILIEDNGFQRVFKDTLVTNTDLPVQGHTTTAKTKNSLEVGLPSLQILFENRKFILPRKNERDRHFVDILVHELTHFTFELGKVVSVSEHDDVAMALHIANQATQSSTFNFSFV